MAGVALLGQNTLEPLLPQLECRTWGQMSQRWVLLGCLFLAV